MKALFFVAGIQNSCNGGIRLMEAETSLCWRAMCRQLQAEAQERCSDVAAMMGSEAALHAAESLNCIDLLENILPATVSDYISLVKAHTDAGTNYWFVTRQLLLVGPMLDFSDATNRKTAATFLRALLQCLPECEVDDDGNVVALVVDNINPGGGGGGGGGEVENGLMQPSLREHKVLLFYLLQGKAIEPGDLFHSLLLSGGKVSPKFFSEVTNIQASQLHHRSVGLISLYFGDEKRDLQRLRQCLSVFSEHYPYLLNKYKELLSKAFVLVIRSMWPGIDKNPGGSIYMVSNLRKCAVQASRFLLQMMEAPLYAKESKKEEASPESSESIDSPDWRACHVKQLRWLAPQERGCLLRGYMPPCSVEYLSCLNPTNQNKKQ
ncbi:hypothetical protein MLD38_001201 [Melastoma candidum]|uniref:Uncharacterized protein n=1 Tax=Melastoma candidum TaxID=119954 RepID=A0ACB9SE28_9MYRT|nr:hypothetical protein MLD38_001201 [Melastoma candidum]